MNATFNIRRQGLTIYKELLEKYQVILGCIGILLLVYILTWLLSFIFDGIIHASGRAPFVSSMLTIICSIIPFVMYKNESRRREGLFYAVSPSSTLEKTISMLVIASIIFPLLATVMLLSLDSLLTYMPFEHGYSGNLWGFFFSTKRSTELTADILGSMNVPADSTDMIHKLYDSIKATAIPPIVGMAINQSFFIFLNMLFRRHKIGYTLLTFLCIGIAATAATVIFSIVFYAKLQDATEIDANALIYWFTNRFVLTAIIITYVLPIIFWLLTYLRIRRIQY